MRPVYSMMMALKCEAEKSGEGLIVDKVSENEENSCQGALEGVAKFYWFVSQRMMLLVSLSIH